MEYAIDNLGVNNLVDLRRRTRVRYGYVSGRAVRLPRRRTYGTQGCDLRPQGKADLASFLNERWKGMAPIAWGDTLRESEYTTWVYESVCGLSDEQDKTAQQ